MRTVDSLEVEDRDRLCLALNRFIVASDALMQDLWSRGPAPGSRGEVHLADQSKFRFDAAAVLNTHQDILFGIVSAIDHGRAFTIQLDSGVVSMALATTDRATLEAIARASWMLQSSSADDLVLRHLSLTNREMNMQLKIDPAGVLPEIGGQDTTVQAEADRVLDAIREVAPDGRPLACSATTLTAAFATRLNTNGRGLYSHLSAVAHGEALGVNSFLTLTTNNGRRAFSFRLSADRAVNYAENVFTALSLGIRDFLSYYDYPNEAAGEWGRLHDECLRVLLELRPSS